MAFAPAALGCRMFSTTLPAFGVINEVKDELATCSYWRKVTPFRKVRFIDRLTGEYKDYEGVVFAVVYDQNSDTRICRMCMLETTHVARTLKVGDLVILKDDPTATSFYRNFKESFTQLQMSRQFLMKLVKYYVAQRSGRAKVNAQTALRTLQEYEAQLYELNKVKAEAISSTDDLVPGLSVQVDISREGHLFGKVARGDGTIWVDENIKMGRLFGKGFSSQAGRE